LLLIVLLVSLLRSLVQINLHILLLKQVQWNFHLLLLLLQERMGEE